MCRESTSHKCDYTVFAFLQLQINYLILYNYIIKEHTTVLILGGGMAGVAAAYTLQSNGMQDFLLLEASDRLGGRISNIKFCGS